MLRFNQNSMAFTEGIIGNALDKTKSTASAVTGWNKDDELSTNLKRAGSNIGSAAKNANDKIKEGQLKHPSIVARARNSVMHFPVYISQSNRVNVAHVLSKLFERVYVTLVQTALSTVPIIDENEVNDLLFLKKYHTNIKEAAEVLINQYYRPIDDIDAILQESIAYSEQITENCSVSFRVIPAVDDDIIMENARLVHEPLAGFGYFFEVNRVETTSSTVTSDEEKKNTNGKELSDEDIEKQARERLADLDDLYSKDTNEFAIVDAINKWKKDARAGKIKGVVYDNGRYIQSTTNKSKTTNTNQTTNTKTVEEIDTSRGQVPMILKDKDIKKINGLDPWSFEVTFKVKPSDGGNVYDIHYVLGVKTDLHLIRTQDLAEDLNELVTGKIKSLQKVKYKTGEISFLDYFLNIKGLKKDALKSTNQNKRWINSLKRLADYTSMNGTMLKNTSEFISKLTNGSFPIPNGTLILTQADVSLLTSQTGIDLSVASNAKKLASNLFLIAVAIVDPSAETMRVLFPEESNSWEIQSLASIEADIAKTDNSQLLKELNKSINNGGR